MEQLLIDQYIVLFSTAPGLDISSESVAGVDRGEDGSYKLVVALKMPVKDPKTGEQKVGILEFDVPIEFVGRRPTVAEVKAAGRPLWGLVKLGPGVWNLSGGPVRFTPRQAGFFTITEVPEPAPFEPGLLTVVPG